jgi:Fe-S-cluster containining protein
LAENIRKKVKLAISFSCLCCGNCCRVGFIYLRKGEAGKIAAHLNITEKDFKKKYTHWFLWQGRTMKWDDSGSCKFQKDNKCLIYPVRPSQCSSWPLWPRLINSRKELERVKEYCKGIKAQKRRRA